MNLKTNKMSTAEINRNFKIKVSGRVNGEKVHSLFGVSGVKRLLEESKTYEQDQEVLFAKLVNKAFDCPDDKLVCKLRRGIKITFYRF